MNKKFKIILIGVVSIVIGYYSYIIYYSFKNAHDVDWVTYRKYSWIFKDSIKFDTHNPPDIREIAIRHTKERDVLIQFNYKEHYFISIWEFKDLKGLNLKNTLVNLNMLLGTIEFKSGEILNAHENPEIHLKYDLAFRDTMQINLDRQSSIIKNIEAPNYKGFYGIINRMTFSNSKYEDLILFEYTKPTPTLFLLYKTSKSFYVIMVQGDKPFDESMINIFNLK